MRRRLTVKIKNRLFRSLSSSNIFSLMRRFTGKVVIVTGASSGIGQTAALSFAEEGASLVIHGQSKERLDKTEKLLLAEGIGQQNILKVLGSMEDPKTAERIVAESVRKFGRIDVLVNNAGALSNPNVKPEAMENLDYLYNVNLKSVILLSQLALPHLLRSKGNVVNVSSVLAFRNAMAPYYSMLKAALDHWTRSMALTWGPKGVRFNCVNPNATKTVIFEKNGITGELKRLHERWVKTTTPMGRFGETYEVATAVKFLASEDSAYITGVCLPVDGGWTVASVSMDQLAV